jgi:hypothetical protein
VAALRSGVAATSMARASAGQLGSIVFVASCPCEWLVCGACRRARYVDEAALVAAAFWASALRRRWMVAVALHHAVEPPVGRMVGRRRALSSALHHPSILRVTLLHAGFAVASTRPSWRRREPAGVVPRVGRLGLPCQESTAAGTRSSRPAAGDLITLCLHRITASASCMLSCSCAFRPLALAVQLCSLFSPCFWS